MNSDFDATTAAWRELIFGLREIHHRPCMKAAPEIKKFVAALEDICMQIANSEGVETLEGAMKALGAGFRRRANEASTATKKSQEHGARKKQARLDEDKETVLTLRSELVKKGITTALTAPYVVHLLKSKGRSKMSEKRARDALKEIRENDANPG